MSDGKVVALFVALAVSIVPGTLGAITVNAADAPTIEIALQNDEFSPAEVKVAANTAIVLEFVNRGQAAAEIESKDMNIEKVVVGNPEIIVRVRPLKTGRYLYVNEYKEDATKGYVVVE